MQDVCSEDNGKFRIGGIKLSQELVQYNLSRCVPMNLVLTPLLRHVAEHRINLTFLSLNCSETGSVCSFCIDADDRNRFDELVALVLSSERRLDVIAPIGTITVFPHHHSLRLVGLIVDILGKARIPMHALCTSLSSLAITTDYQLLDQAVDELQKVLDLPSNHAPFYSEFDLKAIKL